MVWLWPSVFCQRCCSSPCDPTATACMFATLPPPPNRPAFSLVPVLCCRYGRTNDLAVCWTRSNATGHRAELNLYTWLLFTGPLLLIYVFSTGAVIFASRRLREGLPETYKTRMGVFRNSARYLPTYHVRYAPGVVYNQVTPCLASRYVFGYIVYWTILGSLYAAVYFNEGQESSFVRYALAVVTGCRGLVTLAVWLWTQNMQEVGTACTQGLWCHSAHTPAAWATPRRMQDTKMAVTTLLTLTCALSSTQLCERKSCT